MHGIVSPRLKSHSNAEQILAKISKDALHTLVYDKVVELKNVYVEKYGRLCADIYINHLHVNMWLLDNKYVIQYTDRWDGSLCCF